MGAQPKRKISKARKGRRRAHDALDTPVISVCPRCGNPKRPHFECPACGHYGPAPKQESSANKAEAKQSKK